MAIIMFMLHPLLGKLSRRCRKRSQGNYAYSAMGVKNSVAGQIWETVMKYGPWLVHDVEGVAAKRLAGPGRLS
jgi:hypothetical protein